MPAVIFEWDVSVLMFYVSLNYLFSFMIMEVYCE